MNEIRKLRDLMLKIRKSKRELKVLKALNRSDETIITNRISEMLGEVSDLKLQIELNKNNQNTYIS